jgi:hypothetical protein
MATRKPRKWIPIPIIKNALIDKKAILIRVLPVILICFMVEVDPEIQISCILLFILYIEGFFIGFAHFTSSQ